MHNRIKKSLDFCLTQNWSRAEIIRYMTGYVEGMYFNTYKGTILNAFKQVKSYIDGKYQKGKNVAFPDTTIEIKGKTGEVVKHDGKKRLIYKDQNIWVSVPFINDKAVTNG